MKMLFTRLCQAPLSQYIMQYCSDTSICIYSSLPHINNCLGKWSCKIHRLGYMPELYIMVKTAHIELIWNVHIVK